MLEEVELLPAVWVAAIGSLNGSGEKPMLPVGWLGEIWGWESLKFWFLHTASVWTGHPILLYRMEFYLMFSSSYFERPVGKSLIQGGLRVLSPRPLFLSPSIGPPPFLGDFSLGCLLPWRIWAGLTRHSCFLRLITRQGPCATGTPSKLIDIMKDSFIISDSWRQNFPLEQRQRK